MGKMKELVMDISERVMEVAQQGFECREEMEEEFEAIADEFNVPVQFVWDAYNEADYSIDY